MNRSVRLMIATFLYLPLSTFRNYKIAQETIMKTHDLIITFKVLLLFALLLSSGFVLNPPAIFAQRMQIEPGQPEIVKIEEPPNMDLLFNVWMLAVRYRFEEIPDNYDISQDPKMQEIWNLRGNDLRYFLDSIEAINQVQNAMFPPVASDTETASSITLAQEYKLIEIVTESLFAKGSETQNSKRLSESDKAYIKELGMVLNAIMRGDGDGSFTQEYLEYRDQIIPFIEDTEAKLFNPSQKFVDNFLEYYALDDEQSIDLSLNPTPLADCTTTYTIDNWPSQSSAFSGNTGSSWAEAKAHDQSDCDIFVSYYMGSIPHYGVISANTSSAQCVLGKNPQLRGSWSGNFNRVQYGEISVTWGWPVGCSTTGNALRGATKWRP